MMELDLTDRLTRLDWGFRQGLVTGKEWQAELTFVGVLQMLERWTWYRGAREYDLAEGRLQVADCREERVGEGGMSCRSDRLGLMMGRELIGQLLLMVDLEMWELQKLVRRWGRRRIELASGQGEMRGNS
jgi:hypothetical protein